MSKNIKSSLLKIDPNPKLDNLINSYNLLKSILSPNLNENNNHFMNSLIDLIISQLKIFIELLNLTETAKIYEILNNNNQNLSRQIAYLYDISKYSENNTSKSIIEKERNNNNKYATEYYPLEEPKHSFNLMESHNFDLNENKNEKDSKEINIQNMEEANSKELKDSKIENLKEKKVNKKESQKEKEKEKGKILKRDKEEKEKIKEKEKMIQDLKKHQKDIIEKARKIIKRNKIKEKEKQKTQLKKSVNLNKKKVNNIKNIDKTTSKIIKFDDNLSIRTDRDTEKEGKIKTPHNKVENPKLSEINTIIRNKTPSREKNKYKYYLNDDNIYETNANLEEDEKFEKKYQRKNKRSKTVLFEPINIPFLIGLDNFPLEKYISVGFANRLLNKCKSQTKKKKKDNLIQIIVEEDGRSNNSKKLKKNNSKAKTEFIIKNKNMNNNRNLSNEYFSLDELLTPYNIKNGEELYLTKSGSIVINKKQKDILEDYINNYLFEDNSIKSRIERNSSYNIIPLSKGVKEKLKSLKTMKNKKFKIKGTNTQYDINDINELLKILPAFFQMPIDNFYLKKKKASLFDRSIFKICHKVIDNYKELESKEDIFSLRPKLRNKTKSKSKTKSCLILDNPDKNGVGYRKLYSN